MRKFTFLAVLEPDQTGAYSVYFPDLDGCVSYGIDIENAQYMAKEALELHIYGMEKDGEKVPEPVKKIDTLPAGCIVTAVSILPDMVRDEMDNRRVKTTIALPAYLKERAEQEGINFSRVLETSLKEILHSSIV